MTTLVHRADLLACLKQYDSSHLDDFAAILGYTATENSEKAKTFEIVGSSSITLTSTSTMSFTAAPSKIQASFLRVVAHRRFGEDEIVIDEPEWYRSAHSFKYNDATLKAPVGLTPPPQPPLMPWFRLWPFLKLALGAKVLSHKPDLPCVVDRLARGEMLRRLPKARRKGWASQAQLIIDYDESLLPFWSDFNDLRLRLADLRGQAGLNVLAFPAGDPGGTCWQDTPSGWREVERYRPPLAGTPVLILSDLGCNEASEQRRLRWRRFGEQLVRSACRAVALMPSPPRWWEDELTKLFISVYWDRAIRPPQRLARCTAYSAIRKVERDFSSAERLLTLLGTAVRVEPALLRAARYQFPVTEMDAGAEFAAWNHPAVHATHLAFYFQQAQVARYRSRFRDDAGLTPDQKQRIAELLQSHHAHLSPVITHEEQLAKAELLGEPCPQDAEEFAQRLAKTLSEARGEVGQLSKQWLRRMGVRQHASLWNNDALAAAWIKAQAEGDLTGMAMPEGLSLEKLAWTLPPRAVVARQIRQLGQELVFSDSVSVAPGSLLGEVRHSTSVVQVENLSEEGTQTLSLLYDIDQPIPLIPCQRLRIRTVREELHLDWMTKPTWADAIGREGFGLYADLNLNGIVQRFRWIAPGTFQMGSPVSEPERLEREIQHEVTLTRGFWLADSACTQAFWTAVMGENPSRFQDDINNPVENVSWDDVRHFYDRLNRMNPVLGARLPSEAEWEYACRAGTDTPFSFGDNITPEQVNYNGNYPYASGIMGLYREITVPVKSLPANPWGLYEMHGNVWEWCSDWYGDYAAEAVVDPPGPLEGSYRVLRGGSWGRSGGNVRSALRLRFDPAVRLGDLGFRLALGPEGASGQAGQEGREATAGKK